MKRQGWECFEQREGLDYGIAEGTGVSHMAGGGVGEGLDSARLGRDAV